MKIIASAVCVSLVAGRARVLSDDQLIAYENGVDKLHLENLIQNWNKTQGPPPRGWYNLKFELTYHEKSNDIIKKSGLSGETSETFEFKWPEEHYCRFRNVDNEQCCDREDQNCFTDAGCFCDEACYTIYGDCCQDHWVTCYDDLKLCLKNPKDMERSADVDGEMEGGTYGMEGSNVKKNKRPKLQADDAGLFGMQHDFVPTHVAPNACCGIESYNDSVDCCVVEGGRKYIKRNAPCDASVEEEGEEDERAASPDQYTEEEEANYAYEEEEEI
jgi:hypothetical protein